MTDEQVIQARNALAQWFLSQDIDPANSALVMSNLIAQQLVRKTRNISELQKAIKLYSSMIACDIALELRA